MCQNLLAAALFDNIVDPYLATRLMYDSNVLRSSKDSSSVLSGNRSSFIQQIKAGVALKWQFSQQQVIADLSVNQNWYSDFNELDFTGHDLLGQWKWQVGQKFKGDLSYSNRLMMGNFNQINRFLLNNLENREIYQANANYEIIPDWYLRTQIIHSNQIFSAPSRKQSDLREFTQDYGFRYKNPVDNMIGFHVRITDGKYVNRSDTSVLDNAYTRTTYGLESHWYYSVKTLLKTEIGYTTQEFKHVKSLDFADFVARGSILWEATPKTFLLLEVWREISAADSLTATFVLNEGIGFTPKWTWSETPKVQLELPMSYEKQSNVGSQGANTNLAFNPANTNISNIRLNFNYTPIQNIEMTAFAAYQNYSSSNALRTYTDEMLGLTMKVSF